MMQVESPRPRGEEALLVILLVRAPWEKRLALTFLIHKIVGLNEMIANICLF